MRLKTKREKYEDEMRILRIHRVKNKTYALVYYGKEDQKPECAEHWWAPPAWSEERIIEYLPKIELEGVVSIPTRYPEIFTLEEREETNEFGLVTP